MLKKICLFLFSSVIFFQAHAQIKWPAVTQTARPWTRWWWEGSAVNRKDLSWNLEQFKNAGLGGVEITPIYGVHGYEDQFIDFLSPRWMDMFTHTLKESKRLGLGVDLANATGWPFGGPWVSDADASKTVYYKTYSLNGGEQLRENIVYKQEALVRTANDRTVAADTLKQPVAANKNLQALALDQIIFPGRLPLQLLMAYPEKGNALDLTGAVDGDGKLNWTAPPGKWNLYALFVGLHGKMVERAAPGGEGYAIDHFSKEAAAHYFKKFDERFKGRDVSYLRAFFNDSYEVDDARGQSNWTPQLFEEFKKRRGYDLREHLPALFGKEDAETNSRVVYDYRATIDELLLEHFTQAWKKWGASKGAMVRNQSHGSPANTLDLYSAVDIPETEGTDILRFKFATSAAHVTGKPLASSESATWLNEHFLSSWGDVKKAIDLYFLGGVNHIFYHGTAYSPKVAPWPGWLFYAAVHFQPLNPQWKDFGTLNEYIARVQSFLQKGKPVNDVLLYYPITDRYAEPGRDLLQHFDGMERNFTGTDFEHVSKWMLDKGIGFDFFSDRQMQHFTAAENQLTAGGNRYKAILLPANKLISESSFKKLLELAQLGATVLVYKSLPSDVPGLGSLEQRQSLFRQLTSSLKFSEGGPAQFAKAGKGLFVISQDLEILMKTASVVREDMTEKELQFIKRKNADGIVYFITNRTGKAISEWIPLNTHCISAALFDPMTGVSGLAPLKKFVRPRPFEIYLQLQPFQSIIVQTYEREVKGSLFPYYLPAGEAQTITGEWTIDFITGGPKLPQPIKATQLGSWTESGGEEVKAFSGTAKYSIAFQKPAGNYAVWQLDLGKVNETAEVFLNGRKISTLIGPSFTTTVRATEFKEQNHLDIVVANLMANRIAYMDRNNLPWKIFYNTNMPARKRENVKNGLFDAGAWKPLPSGLTGPVTLTPLKTLQ